MPEREVCHVSFSMSLVSPYLNFSSLQADIRLHSLNDSVLCHILCNSEKIRRAYGHNSNTESNTRKLSFCLLNGI